MSFGYDVKKELLSRAPRRRDLKFCFTYGLFIMGKHFSKNGISIHTEHKEIADLYAEFIFDFVALRSNISITEHHKRNGTIIYLVDIEDSEDRMRVLNFFGYSGDELNRRILLSQVENTELASAFLAGAFLSCGSISDPRKSYHVEFVVDHMKLSQDLEYLMTQVLWQPKVIGRRGSYVLYTKDSSQIEDLMTFMGAVQSSLELMNIKIYKELRNKANRVTNCETANIDKTITAASKQIEDIQYIANTKGLSFLGESLEEVARLRWENPEISLRELGGMLSSPLTRSGVNHRLKRISAIADEMRQRQGSALRREGSSSQSAP
ncbi:MAG: DNA-binding protein WhiA [Oscillospiraceae bacterium]